MSWTDIYQDFDLFKKMIGCTHLPFKNWLYHDEKMRKKLMDDVCKYWHILKPFIEEKFGSMDHPKTLYIYNDNDKTNGLLSTNSEND